MTDKDYLSTQVLTTTINLQANKIKGDINQLILFNLKMRYEGVCNKDGYIMKDSIELINRSIGQVNTIDGESIVMYHITYKADIISPAKGNKIDCVVDSSNKLGIIGYMKHTEDTTLKDSPFIIIVPEEYFKEEVFSSIEVNDTIKVMIESYRTKFLSNQIQVVAKPI